MKQKAPMELGLQLLRDTNIVRHNEFRFINAEFGFVTSFSKMESTIFKIGQPYRLQEGRISIVTRGSARMLINLIEYNIQINHIYLIAPGSIVQIIEVSQDFDTHTIAVDQNFLPISGREEFFTHFLQRKKMLQLTLTTEEQVQIDHFVTVMWSVLQEPVFRKEVIQHLLAALLYNIEYIAKNNGQAEHTTLPHQEDIFQRFISLVNTYSKTERNVSFYADKLCLTPRYLNTVIRQTSQQTVMDWINQSIILEAKVLLKHSNRLVYQISDELNFPNPSFFSKFFKRMTGMTPQEYQKN
ncbi:helix-turn-helix domain-containing protein [Bacteroides thetaiotaomicron]|uniref:helix-turn-helix domain-containing protein n=1 Tax=Bacteroides thetaiotaomicron TaxID=818 RepID=UPI002166292A|nr:helix-turn-helix domain-containing protein [Bacteroides thetaiotaomicron]MCS2714966.1 helix-turn-helix domain-containing protein [Bacteroides thetaiotaomicron]MCS2875250.1 helix-turn-helix domain-containing protein [Bacteroides thetaiotaomicron]